MPEGVLLKRPPQVGKVEGNAETNPLVIDDFLAGLMGQQAPGSLPGAVGAALPMIPLLRALKRLGLGKGLSAPITGGPNNVGDHMLREHVIGSPRLREFQTMQEADLVTPGAVGTDPVQAAYERILNGKGRVKASPPGSGPKVEQKAISWPKEEDLSALRQKYEGPAVAQKKPEPPRRRHLSSGRPLDKK
jgi:hypothetical protein